MKSIFFSVINPQTRNLSIHVLVSNQSSTLKFDQRKLYDDFYALAEFLEECWKGQLSARVFSFLASCHITTFASLHLVFKWEGRATSSNDWGEPH